jgi:hypothetical protein
LSGGGGPVGRLAEFFRRHGYEVNVEEDVLWLRSGRVSGVVRIVGYDAGPSELLSAVIEAARDTAAGFLAYIAAPKTLIEKVGEHVFRLHGLGLLKYTDFEVAEAVSPRIRETPWTQQPKHSEAFENVNETLEKVLKKIESIEVRLDRQMQVGNTPVVERGLEPSLPAVLSRLDVLERRVSGLERLAEEVAELRERLQRLVQHGVQLAAENRPRESTVDVANDNIPSFLNNNPWVDILSKKGRG